MTRPFFFFFFFQISKDSGATGILIQTVFSIYIYIYFVFISNSIRRMVFEILSIKTSSASPVRHSLDVDPNAAEKNGRLTLE